MLEINEKEFPIEDKYIIGVSGGPDSMCLLYTLLSKGYNLIVCNVNYNTRDVSLQEQEMVKKYCEDNNLLFEGLSVKHSTLDKNFEGWAREVRYTFFSQMYKKYQAKGLFIAHHKNDDIETYILQKNRNNIVKKWGLADKTQILGMNVLRPFLKYEKQLLIEECNNNSIPYSLDVTNYQPICERNKIRIDILNKYTKEEIDKLFIEKDKDNEKLNKQKENLKVLLLCNEWKIDDIKNLSEIEQIRFIYEIIVSKVPKLANKMSRKRIEECIKSLFSKKTNIYIPISENEAICKSYGYFKIVSNKIEENYIYILEKPGKLDTRYFSCEFPEDTSFLKIYEDSYPLTIRNVKASDIVTFGNVRKKMNRIMIDEKIPLYKRRTYPIVLDKHQKVAYFPLYKSDKQKTIATQLKFVLK